MPPGWTVEVSTRTVCGFYLLPANPQFARIMVGILAKAQEKYPVQIHAAVAASNHYHLILTPADAAELADFMEFFNGNLAREAGRLIDWHGSFWADRYHLIPISPEPEALVERLRYVLSKGSASYYTSFVVSLIAPLEAAYFKGLGRSSRPSGANS